MKTQAGKQVTFMGKKLSKAQQNSLVFTLLNHLHLGGGVCVCVKQRAQSSM